MKRLLFFIFLFFIFTRCQHYFVPGPYYVPIHTKAGDLTANFGAIHRQIGYSIFNNIGVFATEYSHRYSTSYKEPLASGLSRSIKGDWKSLGVVPYYEAAENFFIEMPVSYGWGNREGYSSEYHEEDYQASFKSTTKYLAFQPTLSLIFGENHDLSFFSRFYFSETNVLESNL